LRWPLIKGRFLFGSLECAKSIEAISKVKALSPRTCLPRRAVWRVYSAILLCEVSGSVTGRRIDAETSSARRGWCDRVALNLPAPHSLSGVSGPGQSASGHGGRHRIDAEIQHEKCGSALQESRPKAESPPAQTDRCRRARRKRETQKTRKFGMTGRVRFPCEDTRRVERGFVPTRDVNPSPLTGEAG
jgi:hypothetical protein